jgi:hypothetical protein
MHHSFDAGYVSEPFTTLCTQYPGADVYPVGQFRVEWGPIFHRGRLDGSARVLVIGQDPAQHETVVRRVLVGEAGHRVQGLLAKLGMTRSYILVNAFLYSAYGSVRAKTRRNPDLIAYRNRWLDALLVGSEVEAVLAFGQAADEAWQSWNASPAARTVNVAYAALTHPTQPESASRGDRTKLAASTAKLLRNWNAVLQTVAPKVRHPDVRTTLVLYGDTWSVGDRVAIPEADFPAGLPGWMREHDGWARRVGANNLAKRRNITVTVTKGVVS